MPWCAKQKAESSFVLSNQQTFYGYSQGSLFKQCQLICYTVSSIIQGLPGNTYNTHGKYLFTALQNIMQQHHYKRISAKLDMYIHCNQENMYTLITLYFLINVINEKYQQECNMVITKSSFDIHLFYNKFNTNYISLVTNFLFCRAS